MKEQLYNLLRSKAISEREEAMKSLKLMGEYPDGIGDNSTDNNYLIGSFHKNAEEALRKLVDAEYKLSTLDKFKMDLFTTYDYDDDDLRDIL
tara:strand:- start:187 stop:462 length:276 start_codon:yes stop_codon:yes gene_type:complete